MLETITIIIVCLVLGIPIFMNTVGPFIVWKTQKLPAIVKFNSVDDGEFIKGRNSEFIGYDKSLKELGFKVIGSSLLQDSQTDSYFRLYWNSEMKVSAMAVTMKSNVEDMTYIELTQKYIDGSVLDVSNSPRPEAYPKLEFKHAYRFPEKLSSRDLLNAHSKLRENLLKRKVPVDYEIARGFGEVEDFINRESEALLQKGIVKPDIDPQGKRRLTLYGAILLTYKAVPPGKNIWGFITERQAKKALGNV